MKYRILIVLSFLLLGSSLSAQNFYMQYSHDTLGNRTSRVRGILTREMEAEGVVSPVLENGSSGYGPASRYRLYIL